MSESTDPGTAQLRHDQEALRARVARLEAALAGFAQALASSGAGERSPAVRVSQELPPSALSRYREALRGPDLELVDTINTALADPTLSLERARELLAAASGELETLDVLADPQTAAALVEAEADSKRGAVVGLDVVREDLERRRREGRGATVRLRPRQPGGTGQPPESR